MKKVLHLITGLEKGGGAEAMLLKTLPNIKATKNTVCVIRGKGIIGKELEKNGIQVFYLEMKNYLDFGIISRYKNIVKIINPDVQVNYLIHADIFGRILGKKFGIKKIVSYIRNKHTEFKYSFLDKITLKKVDFLLTNSKTSLTFYREKYNFPIEKSKCIPNGVKIINKTNKQHLIKLKKELKIVQNDFVITCIARLHKQKSIDTLIKAGQLIKENNKNFKILLCGEGKERKNLENLVKKLKLENNVFFLGNRNDIMDILNISNVFVLPSIKEGMSNALLEAMSMGVPCVVSDIDENKELITHNVNGLIFKVGNYNNLFKQINYINKNNKKSNHFGLNAQKKVVNNYSIDAIIKKFSLFLSNF